MQNLRLRRVGRSQVNLAFLHGSRNSEDWRAEQYCMELYSGARERAEALGFGFEVVWAREPGMDRKRLTSILSARGVHGVLVAPLPLGVTTMDLDWSRFACAALGFSLGTPALPRAGTDQARCMLTALSELNQLGYKRVGVVVLDELDHKMDHAWAAGLAIARRSRPRNPSVSVLMIRRGDNSTERIRAWIRKGRFDAIVDAGTPDLKKILNQMELQTPTEMGFVSLLGKPPTATVLRNWTAIGAAGIDLVVGQLFRNERGIPAMRKTVLIEGTWHAGRTLAHRAKARC